MQSAEIDPKMTQIIKLADKNFKAAIFFHLFLLVGG